MTANSGSADHQDDGAELRQHLPSPQGAPRHLYIIHSADAPRQSSCVARQPISPQLKPQGILDRAVQVQIGRKLRDVFSDVADEPVPERFVMLLEALEAKEKQP